MSNPAKKTAIANLSPRRLEAEGDEPTEVPTRRIPLTQRPMQLRPLPTGDQLELRDALPPPPGYRYTLDGRLVPAIESELSIDDPEAQAIFCEVVEITGSLRAACDALGIRSMTKVKRFIDRNPDFFEEVECAAERHRQSLYAHAVERATVGYMKPIIGGKDKDEVVGYERVVSDSLLTLLLKRHFAEFRDLNKAPAVNVTNLTISNVPKRLTREQRQQLRDVIQSDPAPTGDPSGIIDVEDNTKPPGDN